MSTCPKCNRDTKCIHTNPISQKEMYFLIALIVFISQFAFFLLTLRNVSPVQIVTIDVFKVSLYGANAIVIILIFMIMMYILFKKQYIVLFFGCHQKKERSFTISEIPFILCARCTGILIGFLLAPLVFLVEIPIWIVVVLTIPLLVDGIVQRLTKWESKNLIRLFTGILFAPGIVILYSYINFYIHLGFMHLGRWIISLL